MTKGGIAIVCTEDIWTTHNMICFEIFVLMLIRVYTV